MCTLTTLNQQTRAASYQRLPLTDLIQLIVHHRDLAALYELHEHRTVFRDHNGPPLRLVEYLDRLRQNPAAWSWTGRDANALDRAYDLTYDKFGHLPVQTAPVQRHQPQPKQIGPDCRCYFRAFLLYVTRHWQGPPHSIEAETYAARCLQVFVYRHFRFSCLEVARRLRRTSRRFAWIVHGFPIHLWMPAEMDGDQCRAWLEANVQALDPSRPRERKRIQDIVDHRLSRPRQVRLNESLEESGRLKSESRVLPWSVQQDLSTQGLAEAVANEKVENIDQQRWAIRRLGPQRLGQLIRRIFTDLCADAYRDAEVAREFCISKSSFSRFSGSRFARDRGKHTRPPDLWINLAQVLAGNAVFAEAVKAMGMWELVNNFASPRTVKDTNKGQAEI